MIDAEHALIHMKTIIDGLGKKAFNYLGEINEVCLYLEQQERKENGKE